MKHILSILIVLCSLSVSAQVPNLTWGKKVWATSQFQLGNELINSISLDSTDASKSDLKLITEKAIKAYVRGKIAAPDSLQDGLGTKVATAGTKKYKINLDTNYLKNLLDSTIAAAISTGQYIDSPRIYELIYHIADSLVTAGGAGSNDTTSLQMMMAFNHDALGGNIFLGTGAGYNYDGGGGLIAIGQNAGYNVRSGGENVAIGSGAGWSNGGSNLVAVGQGAGASNSGDYVVAIGYDAGDNNVTGGSEVIAIGRSAGNDNLSSKVIYLGSYTGQAIDSVFENSVAIGDKAFINKSNSIILGSIAGVNGATTSASVGIGTTTPTSTLHVAGGIRADSFKLGSGAWVTSLGSGSGVTTMAAIGSSPNANGATISGSTLTLQPASGSFGGVLTAGAQDIGGAKNFTSQSTWGGTVTVASANSSDFVFSVGRTVTGNDNRHAFGDQTTVNLGRGFAYASYDNTTTFAGDKYFDHHVGFQNRPIISSNDTINVLWGFRDQPTYNTGVKVQTRNGFHFQQAANPVVNSDVIYAFRAEAANAAKADSNFAFHASGGRMMITSVPVVTANYGLISLGAGTAFNGSTTGFFAGAANGTYYAANAASGFVGDLMSLQTAGVTRMAVGGGGNVMIGGPVSLSNSRLTIYNSATSTAVQTQYVNGSTGTGSSNGGVVGLNSSNNLEMNMRQAASLEFKTTNTTRMTINSAGRVIIGTAAAANGSILDIQSTTAALVVPRMTQAQRDAISSPVAGAIVYCTDCTATDASTGVSQTYNGSTWKNHY